MGLYSLAEADELLVRIDILIASLSSTDTGSIAESLVNLNLTEWQKFSNHQSYR